ncbi:MAG: MerR family transcriptional regulator [bacterium]
MTNLPHSSNPNATPPSTPQGETATTTPSSLPDPQALFPIRTVSELTSVNAITLRAWERRYGLIQPQRTEKGHRLYSMQDVEFIRAVLNVLKQGVSIGRVRDYLGTSRAPRTPLADNTMLSEHTNQLSPMNVGDNQENLWGSYQAKIQQAISQFDNMSLDRIYHDMVSQYPFHLIGQEVLLPMLQRSAEKAAGLLAVSAEYHFFHHYLRSRISANYWKDNLENGQRQHSKRLVLASVSQEAGDIPLLLLATDLVTQGYHLIFLGDRVQADALPLALARANALGLILYQTEQASVAVQQNPLQALVSTLTVPIFMLGMGMNERDSLNDQNTSSTHPLCHSLPIYCLPNDANQAVQMINQHYAGR